MIWAMIGFVSESAPFPIDSSFCPPFELCESSFSLTKSCGSELETNTDLQKAVVAALYVADGDGYLNFVSDLQDESPFTNVTVDDFEAITKFLDIVRRSFSFIRGYPRPSFLTHYNTPFLDFSTIP